VLVEKNIVEICEKRDGCKNNTITEDLELFSNDLENKYIPNKNMM
jgi:hypothetical protein